MRRLLVAALVLLPIIVWVATVPAELVADPSDSLPAIVPVPEVDEAAAVDTETPVDTEALADSEALVDTVNPVGTEALADTEPLVDTEALVDTANPVDSEARAAIPETPSVGTSPPHHPAVLLVEPLSAEWEMRLVPPLLQNLYRLAPFVTVRSQPDEALRAVAEGQNRLALVSRSHALSANAEALGLELLEIGPAACLVLVVRSDAPWNHYAELNYGREYPLRVEAVSTGAQRQFEQVLDQLPLMGGVSTEVRSAHVALQRLAARESDLIVLDVPRRGVSNAPADIMAFVAQNNLRLLPLPPALLAQQRRLGLGEVIVDSSWFWQSPPVYKTVCDPFVLAMPRAGSEQLIYGLYSALTAIKPELPFGQAGNGNGNGFGNGTNDEGLLSKVAEAGRRLLTILGLR